MENTVMKTAVNSIIRVAASGSKTIASGAKYLSIDSGRAGAEILSIVVKGVVGADWTLGIYVPAEDAIATLVAGDKRAAIVYTASDTIGGLIEGFVIPFNCFLNFTNTSAGSDAIDQVQIIYRSENALTLAWEA